MESLAFDEFIACQADNQDSIIEFHENLYIASSIKHFVAQGVDYLQCRNCLELIGKLDYYDDKGNHDFGKEKPDLYNPYLCDCGQLAPIDFFQYGFWDIAKICDQFEKEYYLSIPKPDTVAGSNTEDYIKNNIIYDPSTGAVWCKTCEIIFNSKLFKKDFNYPIKPDLCSCGCCSNIIPEKIEEHINKIKDRKNNSIDQFLEIEKEYDRHFLNQLTNSIVVSCPNGEKGGKTYIPMKIIGTGESREFCGKTQKVGFCSDRHKVSERVKHCFCFDRTCPTCWYVWRKREKTAMEDKLEAAEYLFNKLSDNYITDLDNFEDGNPYKKMGNCNHWVVSPPPKWAKSQLGTVQGTRYMRSKLNLYLKKNGLRLGAIIFHPKRVRPWAKKLFGIDKKAGYNKGLWDWLRSKNLIESNAVYVSPHWHIIGYGYLTNYELFHKSTKGWIYKKIYRRENGKVVYHLDRTRKKKLINYLLSHTAALGPRTENKNGAGRYPINSITWIGINGELEKSVKTEKKYDNCPECKREVYEWSGWERVEVFDNELERNVWTYKFNSPDSKDPPKCWDSLEYAFHVYITEICYRLKKHPEIFITFSRCDDENNEMIELDVYQINLDDDFG